MRSPIGLFAVAFWLALIQSIDVNAQTWLNPELIGAGTPNITLTPLINGQFGIQMQEEIAWPFTLVKINYNGKWNQSGPHDTQSVDPIYAGKLKFQFVYLHMFENI